MPVALGHTFAACGALMPMRAFAAALLAVCLPFAAAAGTAFDADRLCRLVADAVAGSSDGSAARADGGPVSAAPGKLLPAPAPSLDTAPVDRSPTGERWLPLFSQVMAHPFDAPCWATALARSAAMTVDSPEMAMRWLIGIGGVPTAAPSAPSTRISAVDPLAAALDWLQPLAAAAGRPWPPRLPDTTELPEPLRREVAAVLGAIGSAYRQLELATKQLPVTLDADSLRAQALHGASPRSAEDSLPRLLPLLDRERLASGMLDLVDAIARFERFLTSPVSIPRIDWHLETPLGTVIVDSTGRDNGYALAAPLLVVDIGGNDRYRFTAAPPARRISVLIDHGGDDRYSATAEGADPSSGTVGYGVVWDTGGDDLHEGRHLAQAAALLGAALLVDRGGANTFAADGHAQGYAFGGFALLLANGVGDDRYHAVTHAQASADPEAAAALIDRGGNDVYTLAATPLVRPSPQLPTLNTSMGQGAGRGLRPSGQHEHGSAGGIGVLVDLAGDDRYLAQVFAQGAGYFEGLGVLVDGGGADTFDAAWYAMGAAAHSAAGVLLKLGPGADRYRATHSTALSAAHDLSVAVFVDEDGDDDYALGDLGLGAAHDDGAALFVDGGGVNRYRLAAAGCRAFGFTQASGSRPTPADAGKAVFADRGCAGAATIGCTRDCSPAR